MVRYERNARNDKVHAVNNVQRSSHMSDIRITSLAESFSYMPPCPTCGRSMMREHRKALQKVIYAESFRCSKCRTRFHRVHPVLRLNYEFVFSRHTRCIRCGTLTVHRLARRDHVDSLSRNVLSQIQRVTGAPVNKCPACRLQYYDWRTPSKAE